MHTYMYDVCILTLCTFIATVYLILQATRLDPENASYKENLAAIEQQLESSQAQVYNIHMNKY